MCLSHQGAPPECSSCQWQWGGLKAFSHGCKKTLVTYNARHFMAFPPQGSSGNFSVGSCSWQRFNLWIYLQIYRVLAVLPCCRGQWGNSTAVGWSWAKQSGSDSFPSLSEPYAMAISPVLTHFKVVYWNLAQFVPAKYGRIKVGEFAAELQSTPIWSHLPVHFRFQISIRQHYSAAISTCLCAEAVVTNLTPKHLCVWSSADFDMAVLRNTPPYWSHPAFFHVAPSFVYYCPSKPARSCVV